MRETHPDLPLAFNALEELARDEEQAQWRLEKAKEGHPTERIKSSAAYRVPLSALAPSFRTRISTRRFCWRPAGVPFSTIGYFGPWPLVAIRSGATPRA